MVDYKLRLGDGTTFSVDEKGLTTWLQGGLVDDKARVQPAGSRKWFSIKQVLAAQGTQRGHAVRQTEKGRADVDRQAAEETAEIEKKVAEQRATEERKAGEELAAAERKAVADRSAAERKLIETREAEVRRAAEEVAAAEARAAAERQAEQDRAEAERRLAEERAETERREAEAREAERLAAAAKRVAAQRAERAEQKRKAEEARLEAEQRAAEEARLVAERQAAEERAAERKAAEEQAAAERRAAEAREAAARETERVAEAERLVAAERTERAERKRRADEERVAQERLAQERAAEERAARERAAALIADSPPVEASAAMNKVEDFGRELGLVPVMFNETSEPVRTAGPGPSELSSPAEPATPAAEGVIGRSVRSLKDFFTPRAIPTIAPPPTPVPSPPPSAAPKPMAAPSPIPKPKPIAAPRPIATPAAPVTRAAPAPQRERAMPPPSFQKMEVIPFAAAPAASRVDEDVWEGEDPEQEQGALSSMFAAVWLWVKRVTIATALIVSVALLALNREKWMPQAKDAANVLGQGVDKLSERASIRIVPPQAIEAARAQIPYLRPQTIELIMTRSTSVLEPVEVFRRAHQAAERARPSLPANVAAEIDNLTGAVAFQLDPTEGDHLRTYLAAIRAGTPTAAYEDKEAVWLMGRGVRRLSAEQLARMEELFAQAVSAALQPAKP